MKNRIPIALVKMPNRPLCQIREFQVTQQKAGAGFGAAKASLAGAGIFVKCPQNEKLFEEKLKTFRLLDTLIKTGEITSAPNEILEAELNAF